MREFLKVTAVLVFGGFALAAVLMWADDRPSVLVWSGRVVFPVMAAAAIGISLKLYFQRDLAPDYLKRYSRTFFDRDGFCFSLLPSVEDGIYTLNVLFQNRYDQPSLARIAIRTNDKFWQPKRDLMIFQIECSPGGFGRSSLPLAVRQEDQGKKQTFQIGASVHYPRGKGKMLRFRDSMVIRHNTDFRSPFGTALTVAGALGGAIVWMSPASFTVTLPSGTAESVPENQEPHTEVLWSLGDDVW